MNRKQFLFALIPAIILFPIGIGWLLARLTMYIISNIVCKDYVSFSAAPDKQWY
jgi:hypothetical protein